MPDARNEPLPGSIYPARPRIRRTQASGNAPREASEGGTRANRHERASSRRECAGSSVLANLRLHSGSVYAPLKLATAVKSDSALAAARTEPTSMLGLWPIIAPSPNRTASPASSTPGLVLVYGRGSEKPGTTHGCLSVARSSVEVSSRSPGVAIPAAAVFGHCSRALYHSE